MIHLQHLKKWNAGIKGDFMRKINFKKESIIDLLVISAFGIIFFTTMTLNIHIAFYLLSLFLLLMAYLIASKK